MKEKKTEKEIALEKEIADLQNKVKERDESLEIKNKEIADLQNKVKERDEVLEIKNKEIEDAKLQNQYKKPVFTLAKKKYQINMPTCKLKCNDKNVFDANQLGKSVIFTDEEIKNNPKLQKHLIAIGSGVIWEIKEPKTS